MEAAHSTVTSWPRIEQRRFPRLHLKTAVQFRNILKPDEPFAGCLCRNISASGICLMTDLFLPRESRWILLISMPLVPHGPVRLIGRVAWSNRRPFGQAYESGIHSIEVTAEDQRMIANFVERGVVPVVS